jgi:predicted SnoaL-like aldol condensation-catalyzing enzyme
MSDSIDSKALVVRYFETVWNARQLTRIDHFVAPTYIGHEPHAPATQGPDGMRQVAETFWNNFPDATFTILNALADGDLVALQVRLQATYRPNGSPILINGMGLYRIAEGQIVESWSYMDERGLVQQLGGQVVFEPGLA